MDDATRVHDLIRSTCMEMAEFLIEKNRRYGNSALQPIRIFSKADAMEQLRVRLDDKLNRIMNMTVDDEEDVVTDLLGYLVLLKVAQRMIPDQEQTGHQGDLGDK